MQILKKVNFKLFLALTILNYLLAAYSFGVDQIFAVTLFFVGVLGNQAMLFAGLWLLLIQKSKSFKTGFLLTGKFLLLAVVFVAMAQHFPDKLPTLVFCYTFQLIILTLSIKRKTTKN